MKKMIRASERTTSERKIVNASRSIADMIDAFEDKLDELKVDSSTHVEGCDDLSASAEVGINREDHDVLYRDNEGGFGVVGETMSLADIKDYWNREHNSDPTLLEYGTFEEWLDDTINNYLEPVGEEYFD